MDKLMSYHFFFYKLFLLSIAFVLTACETIPLSQESVISDEYAAINIQHRVDAKQQTSSDNYTRLGAGYLAQNNYEKAMLKLRKAIRLNDQNANAYSYMGVLYWRLEKTRLADISFKKSIQLSQYNAAINHNYASFLCSSKRYKEASNMFQKVFNNPLYDRLSSAYQVSGDCDLDFSQLKTAEKKYKKALKLNKNNSLAMLGLAKLYYKKGNLKIALYYFERFEKLSKHSPDSLWLGINLQRKMGDKNKLSSYILVLKNLYPDADETLFFVEGKQSY
ncbi:MAG: type IV pilus biogenesis/stability protein PilW [Pseudomonadota bacterium]